MENEKQNEPEIHIEMMEHIPEAAAPAPEKVPENPGKKHSKKRTDPVVIGLMYAVSFLCLCIIGVMIYWLAAFLN